MYFSSIVFREIPNLILQASCQKQQKTNRKETHVLDGLTSSTFRSNWCHDGVVVEGVSGDICFPLKPSTNHVCATRREASYKISRSHGSERESKQRW